MQTTPRTITVYGDSYTAETNAYVENTGYGFAASAALGLGGTDATILTRAAGGCSLKNACDNTGSWTTLGTGASIQNSPDKDVGSYAVLRYGINDVLQHVLANPTFPSFAARQTHFENTLWGSLQVVVPALKAAGKKVILYVPPVLPIASSGAPGWEWSSTHVALADVLRNIVLLYANNSATRVIDQSGTVLTAPQMGDWVHPTGAAMHTLSIDFGQRLRTAITGY